MIEIKKYTEAFASLPENVRAAEVYAIDSRSFSAAVLNGEIDRYSVEETAGVCVRADCGRIGYVCSKNPDDDPSTLIAKAVQNAAYIETDDDDTLYQGAPKGDYQATSGAEKALVDADARAKLDRLFEMEKTALEADPRIERLSECQITTELFETGIANSLGMAQSQSGGFVFGYVCPVATIDGETMDGLGWRAARTLQELDIEGMAEDAAKDLFGKFGASPVASGDYGAVISKEAAADLLAVFSGMFSAERAQKGLSLLNGKEGQQIVSQLISITDDPMCADALIQRAFDDEGVPASRTAVVENGVLMTLLHNRKTAKKAGTVTTGNAGKGGLAAAVEVSPSNFFIVPGSGTQQELLEKLGDGILITEVSGLHAGCNPVSGAFSAAARGFEVKDGKKGRPIDQITVSGNFLELLSDVHQVGGDLWFDFPGNACTGAPSLLIGSIKVAGV